MKKRFLLTLVTCLLIPCLSAVYADTVISSDNFNTDSSANYTLVRGGTDNDAVWAFDYSALSPAVPVAPRTTDGSTKGLALWVNHAGPNRSVMNVFTNNTLSGDYRITVDVYGWYTGTSGTTNEAQWGINHSGTKNINVWQIAGDPYVPDGQDGYYMTATIDGGFISSDYIFQAPAGTDFPGLTWGDATTNASYKPVEDPLFATTIFPSTGGVFGMQWVTIKMEYKNKILSVWFNGNKVWDYDDPADIYTSGKFLMGMEDDYGGSINVNEYTIFDNLLVEAIVIPTPTPTPTPTSIPLSCDRSWGLYE